MLVTFYLTAASANTDAGPFNISGTTSGGAANTVEIQAGVSKATLLAGYTEEIANNITGGTITSTGSCTTTDTWDINELFVTPTPTPVITSYVYTIETTGGASALDACNIFSSSLGETVYAATASSNSVVQFFTDPQLTLGFNGSSDYHAFRLAVDPSSSNMVAQVSAGGFISSGIVTCTSVI